MSHINYTSSLRFFCCFQYFNISSKFLAVSFFDPSILIRIAWSRVSSPSLLRKRVFISFMLLKLLSTVAVLTGRTIPIVAKRAKVGKPATKVVLVKKLVTTLWKPLIVSERYCL